jgi:hypothetical protein
MEPWKFCRQVVPESHHFEEEQDPDPHLHQNEKCNPDPDPHSVMLVCNTNLISKIHTRNH